MSGRLKRKVLSSRWQLSAVTSNLVGVVCTLPSGTRDTDKYEYNTFDIDMKKVHEMELDISYYGGVTGGVLVVDDDLLFPEGLILLLHKTGKFGAMFSVGSVIQDKYNKLQQIEISGCRDEFGSEDFFQLYATTDEVKKWTLPERHTYDFKGRVNVNWIDTTQVTNTKPVADSPQERIFYRQRTLAEMCDILAQSTEISLNYDDVLHSQSSWHFDGNKNLRVDTHVPVVDLVDGKNCALDKDVLYDFDNIITKILYSENDSDKKTGIVADDVTAKAVSGERATELSVQSNKKDKFFDKYIKKLLQVNSLPNFRIKAYGVVLDDLIPFGCTVSGLPDFDVYATDIKEHLSVRCKPGSSTVTDPTKTINQIEIGKNAGYFNSFEVMFMSKSTVKKGYTGRYTMGWGKQHLNRRKKVDRVLMGDASRYGYYFKDKYFGVGVHSIIQKFNPKVKIAISGSPSDETYVRYINKDSPYGFFKADLISVKYKYKFATLPFGNYFNIFYEDNYKKYYPVTRINAVWNGKDFVADVSIERTPRLSGKSIQSNISVWNIPRSNTKKKR